MNLKNLYNSDTPAGKKFKDYCDHWVNNPGAEYTNAGKSLSLDQIFDMVIVKAYAEVLMNSEDSSEENRINRTVLEDEDKSC